MPPRPRTLERQRRAQTCPYCGGPRVRHAGMPRCEACGVFLRESHRDFEAGRRIDATPLPGGGWMMDPHGGD